MNDQPYRPAPIGLYGHVIVCGLGTLGLRIVEVLQASGVPVVVLDDDPDPRMLSLLQRWGVPYIAEAARMPDVLLNAGLVDARAVVCVEAGDLQNLETALVARGLRPDVRMILQMTNAAVGAAMGDLLQSGAALDVADLAAPSLVQACRGSGQVELTLGGAQFLVSETVVTRPGTLRSIFGDLVPIAVVTGGTTVHVCPGRDLRVGPGDRVSVLGTPGELGDAFGNDRARIAPPPAHASRWGTVVQAVRSVAQGAGMRLGVLLLAVLGLVVVATVVLRLTYRTSGGGHLSVLNALYFTVETISTVGYGDFSFADQSAALRVFAIVVIVLGATAITAVFAVVTDLLFSRRISDAFGLQRVTRLSGHVVVIGLGAVGLRVAERLVGYALPVVVIEKDDQNRHLPQGRSLHLPIVIGDATQKATFAAANVAQASAVAILTSDDLTNLETGLSLRQHLKDMGVDVPIVMRIFDRPLGRIIEDSFGFRLVRSTSALAAPWFVGAALGLDVLSTFYIEHELLLVACLTVAPLGGLAGLAMQDLSARIRVIAIRRLGDPALEHPPRRATRFAPGDRAFLIGPYEELVAVLERDAAAPGPGATPGLRETAVEPAP